MMIIQHDSDTSMIHWYIMIVYIYNYLYICDFVCIIYISQLWWLWFINSVLLTMIIHVHDTITALKKNIRNSGCRCHGWSPQALARII
jgi:hypothetical protein